MLIPTPDDIKRARARRYLSDYVETTSRLKLHRWQRDDLCPKLDELGKGKGKRYIVGAPPQFGKSILLTKRLPAQKLGQNPLLRIGIAAYNITHAERLSGATKNTLLSAAHKDVFRDPDGWIPERCSAGEFSTFANLRLNEAQPSVAAYGLNAGFTGNGVDVLLIDDPYSTPDDAFSDKINEGVWRWWDELASVRLNDETDVVAMFHRYHKKDLAGRLLDTGEWEYLRFPAIADDDEDGTDPTRYWRGIGELLSPIRSQAFIDDKKRKNPTVFAAQFQQQPRDKEGALFKREMFEVIDRRPHVDLWMRGIDPASSVKQTNDHTATALVGIDSDNSIVIADVTAWRRTWPETRDGRWEGRPYEKDYRGNPLSVCVEDGLVQIMHKDQSFIEAEAQSNSFNRQATYLVGFAKKGMGLPMVQDLAQNELVAHVPLYPVEEGVADKLQKASVWASKAYVRPIRLVRGSWNEWFIQLCLDFRGDGTSDDDAVDAVSVAMILLRQYRGNELEEERLPDPNSHAYYDALIASQYD